MESSSTGKEAIGNGVWLDEEDMMEEVLAGGHSRQVDAASSERGVTVRR